MSGPPSDRQVMLAIQGSLTSAQHALQDNPDAATRVAAARTALGFIIQRRDLTNGLQLSASDHEGSLTDLVAREAAEAAASLPIPLADWVEHGMPNFESLASTVATFLATSQPVEIIDCKQLSGGFSRDTLAVTYHVAASTSTMVVRREQPNGLLDGIGLTTRQEYQVLKILWAHAVPVAEPLWCEAHSGMLGAPYLASRKVEGRALGTSLGGDGVQEHHIEMLAKLMARLHTLPLQDQTVQLGQAFDLASWPTTRHAATRALLERWERYLRDKEIVLSPALHSVHRWLYDNLPDDAASPCLLHGDVGFHNVLFEHAEVAALLDWEMAFPGSPAKDLAQLLKTVTAHVPWERFMVWYCSAGGEPVPQSELRYFQIFSEFCNVVVCKVAGDVMLERSAKPDIRYIHLAVTAKAHFLANLDMLLSE